MARMKVVKEPNESADIPETDPIQVELKQEIGDEEKEIDLAPSKEEKKEDKPKQEDDQEEVVTLKKQLETITKAAEEHKKLAEQAQKDRQQAIEQSNKKDAELTTAGDRVELAELDAINNAIAAAETEAASAQNAYVAAQTDSDWAKAAEAQRRMSRAETRLLQLEDGKASLEARREWAKTQPKKQPQAPSMDAYIDTLPLNGAQRDWLKKHPELMQDHKKNVRLQNADYDAQDKGLAAGSEAYFQFVEERLGYRQPETKEEEVDEEVKPERKALVSAPVSRNAPSISGKPSTTRITLSPEQRSAAKAAGVDEVTYARNLIKLQEAKKAGAYGEH